VSRPAGTLALASLMTMLCAGSPVAAQDTDGEVAVARDLTAVIALQGLPCGQVVNASQQAENDYVAACENGDRYRVFVTKEGRVVVEKID